MRNLHSLVKNKHVIGIEDVKFKKDHLCGACEAGNMTNVIRNDEESNLPKVQNSL